MSHSRSETEGCRPLFHVLDEEAASPPSTDAVESWLSSRYAVPAEPEEPEIANQMIKYENCKKFYVKCFPYQLSPSEITGH